MRTDQGLPSYVCCLKTKNAITLIRGMVTRRGVSDKPFSSMNKSDEMIVASLPTEAWFIDFSDRVLTFS